MALKGWSFGPLKGGLWRIAQLLLHSLTCRLTCLICHFFLKSSIIVSAIFVTVFMDKRIQRQFQGFHSVLTFQITQNQKPKSLFSPINEEMPILKLIMHFGLCHARALLFFVFCFVFVVVFSIQIGINSFLSLICTMMMCFWNISIQHP